MNNFTDYLTPINANIISIVLILSIVVLIKKSYKKTSKITTDEFKENLTPAEISSLVFGNMKYVKSITSTLFYLSQKGNIKLNVLEKDFSIDFLNTKNLNASEKYLLDFFKSTKKLNLNSKDLLKERKSAPDDFNKAMQKYFDLVENSLFEKKLKKKNDVKNPTFIILISLMYLIVSILLAYNKGFLALLIIPLSLILAFNEAKKIFEKTPQGERIQTKYFNMIENFENGKLNINSINQGDLLNLIALGAKNEKLELLLKLNSTIDYKTYKTVFDCNNLIFADKKSR